MSNRPEVLAPAGSMDALKAAVECGADAVYLGAGLFNARRNAQNFSEEELADAVRYCHVRGVKVHLALNTLVSDEELPAAMELVQTACGLGVDALIVQDLGLARLIRQAAPDMELHASTQMAVMTAEGFLKLAELGFSRAVLPRELSLEEIRAIRAATEHTGLELELFIHGALCMCVSGQCYLSAQMGGRSGNRGLCAQPCRLPFAAGGSGHALSLKDLSAVEFLPELFAAGVTSFKIEGRMKRPEYVAAAVTACRNAADGVQDPNLLKQLDAVFSRSGHTDGYLTGTLGASMFGTRRKDDVLSAAPILKDLSQLYAKETRATPVSMDFTARLGAPLQLTATVTDRSDFFAEKPPVAVSVSTEGDYVVQAAQKVATTKEKVLTQLGKTGGTGFAAKPEAITVSLDDSVNIPASVLNNLRRTALEKLAEAIVENRCTPFTKPAKASRPTTDTTAERKAEPFTETAADAWKSRSTFARLLHADQLPENSSAPEYNTVAWVLPLHTEPSLMEALRLQKVPFGVEVPRGLYQNTGEYRAQLHIAGTHGAQFAFAGTLDGVVMAQSAGLPVLGGHTLNVFNRQTLRQYQTLGVEKLCVSQELTGESIRQLAVFSQSESPHTGILAYGRSPLMLTRNMPDGLTAMDFRDLSRLPVLTDRKQVNFPVAPNGDAFELINSVPLYLADKPNVLPNNTFRLFYFTTETEAEVAAILRSYRTGEPFTAPFTRGLYARGVL